MLPFPPKTLQKAILMFGKPLKIYTWSNEGFGYRIFTFTFMAQTAYWTSHKKTMVLHFYWEFLHHIG